MYCQNCGKELRKGDNYCPQCGTAVEKISDWGRCPRCGSRIEIDREKTRVTCPNCRMRFKTENIAANYENPPIGAVYASPEVFQNMDKQEKGGVQSRLFRGKSK